MVDKRLIMINTNPYAQSRARIVVHKSVRTHSQSLNIKAQNQQL